MRYSILCLRATFVARKPDVSCPARPRQFPRQTTADHGPRLHLFLLLLLGLLAGPVASAQDVSTYQFAASSGTFTPITGGTTVATLSQPDEISPSIALPFTFYYGGTAYTALQATTRGYLTFNNNRFAYAQNELGYANNNIAVLWDALSGTGGTASYVITGTPPNRVFTFQWLNWRWNAAATAANISFQAKLYEGTNVIQFIYRPEAGSFTSANASATIGMEGGSFFAGDRGSYQNFVSLSDASPAATPVNNLNPGGVSMNAISDRPVAGQTYTFTPINDYCGHATPLTYGNAVVGSTSDATMLDDPQATCTAGGTGTPASSPGVFYRLVGNGQPTTVSTCSGPTATGGNTRLFVYSGTCGNFTCVGNNDNVLAGGCGTNPLASAVTFATQAGTPYYVFVQYAQQGATGPVGLQVSTALATRAALGAGHLEVFPNPATRAFTLQLPALTGERTAQLTLLNSLGQAVQVRTVTLNPAGTQVSVEVQALPAGLYTVRVQTGGQVASQQVVMQ